MAKKFIINDGEVITGRVKFHEDLVTGGRERSKTIGGGFWHYSKQENLMFFWGSSSDFGKVTAEQFWAATKPMVSEDIEVIFSYSDDFGEVLTEFQNGGVIKS